MEGIKRIMFESYGFEEEEEKKKKKKKKKKKILLLQSYDEGRSRVMSTFGEV